MTEVFSNARNREKHPLTEFFTVENIEEKTELSREDLQNVLEIEYMNNYFKETYKIDLGLDKVTKAFKLHMVSLDRKGRTEGMDVMKAQELHQGEENATRSLTDRLLGR